MLSKEAVKQVFEKTKSMVSHYATFRFYGTDNSTTRFANSEINQNIAIKSSTLVITVYDGKKSASCSTNVLSDDGIKQMVESAEELLKYVPDGEFPAFPFSTDEIPTHEDDGKLAGKFDSYTCANILKEGLGYVEKDYTAAGALNVDRMVFSLGDSEGAFRYTSSATVKFNTVVTHISGAAGGDECISYTKAPDILNCFKKAQSTAKAARDTVEPELGGHTVVLSPIAFADLISFACYPLNAKSVEDGGSYAVGKLGEKVFGDNLTIKDVPGHKELLPYAFDEDGNKREQVTLIEKGVVKSFLYDNVMAAKHNVKSTGHSVGNGYGGYAFHVVVDGGEKSLEEIIAGIEKGIFINEFHYTNFVNARNLQITGLTRNGTFLIENGKLTKPISTVRFTESLLDAFNNITELTKEQTLVAGSTASLVPGVRIENFHFTSKS